MASALATRAAWAINGASPIAIGAEAAGRGSADAAIAEDSTALLTNPAGLAWSRGSRLDLILVPIWTSTSFQNKYNDKHDGGGPGVQPIFSVVLDPSEALARPKGARKPQPSDWRWGFGVVPLAGSAGRSRINTKLHPEGKDQGADLVAVAFGVGAAKQLSPRLSVGLSLQYYMLRIDEMETSIRTREFGTPGSPTTPNTPILNALETLLNVLRRNEKGFGFDAVASSLDATAVGGNLGVLWRATDSWTVGLAWNPQVNFGTASGRVHIDADAAVEDIRRDLNLSGGFGNFAAAAAFAILTQGGSQGLRADYKLELRDFAMPQRLAIGAAWAANDHVRVAADLRWIDWSRAFNKFRASATGGNNPAINDLTGDRDWVNFDIEMDWKDQYVFGAGLEYQVDPRVVLRTGYNYGRNPVPKNSLGPSTAAITEHHLTLGFGLVGWGGWKNWRLDASWVHAIRKAERSGLNDQNVDFDDTRVSSSMDQVYVGFAYSF